MSDRLAGKVVIVTGGTRGMGEAEVRGIVAHGGCVVFGGRDEAAGNAIAADLGERAIFVPQDVAVKADWERIVGTAIDRFGRIDGLVNNAGYASSQPLRAVSAEEIAKSIEINQIGVLLGMQHVESAMREAGSGSIVNIASPAGIRAHRGLSVYGGTKAAVIAMSRAVAAELAPKNIRVNIIVPGFFATRLLLDSSNGQGVAMGAERTPMRRVAQPDEIVGPVVFLLSDESSFVTGATLAVDGGYTM